MLEIALDRDDEGRGDLPETSREFPDAGGTDEMAERLEFRGMLLEQFDLQMRVFPGEGVEILAKFSVGRRREETDRAGIVREHGVKPEKGHHLMPAEDRAVIVEKKAHG